MALKRASKETPVNLSFPLNHGAGVGVGGKREERQPRGGLFQGPLQDWRDWCGPFRWGWCYLRHS